jgi:hypothetical protein
VHAEEYTSRGMSDLVLVYRGDVWVIELKKASTQVALQQIKERATRKSTPPRRVWRWLA